MKYIEIIKKIGIKKVILYESLHFLEIFINLPYLFLREIIIIFGNFLELLQSIFCEDRIINLSKLSKRIDTFRINTIKETIKEARRIK